MTYKIDLIDENDIPKEAKSAALKWVKANAPIHEASLLELFAPMEENPLHDAHQRDLDRTRRQSLMLLLMIGFYAGRAYQHENPQLSLDDGTNYIM